MTTPQSDNEAQRRASHVVLSAFLAVAILAGGNSVAIRFSNRELEPLWGATVRFAIAGLLVASVVRLPPIHPVALNTVGMAAALPVLAAAALVRGESFIMRSLPETWIAVAYVAAIGSVIVFLLQVFVVQHWTASRSSYVMVLIPIVTVALSAWLDHEPITVSLALGGLLIIAAVYVGALRRPTS